MLPEMLLSTRSLLSSQIMPGGCSVRGTFGCREVPSMSDSHRGCFPSHWCGLVPTHLRCASLGLIRWHLVDGTQAHTCNVHVSIRVAQLPLKLCPPLPSGLSRIYFPASVLHLSEQMGIPNAQILNANSLSSQTLSSFPFLKLIYHFLTGQRREMIDLFRQFVKLDKDSCTSWVSCVRDLVLASAIGSVHRNHFQFNLWLALFEGERVTSKEWPHRSRMEHVSLIFLGISIQMHGLRYYLSFKWDDTWKKTLSTVIGTWLSWMQANL